MSGVHDQPIARTAGDRRTRGTPRITPTTDAPVTVERRIRIVGKAIVTRNTGAIDQRHETTEKIWPHHNVMRLSACRAWVTRTFNRLRRDLGPNDSLRVHYAGQMQEHPFTPYGGGLRGTTRIRMAEGDME